MHNIKIRRATVAGSWYPGEAKALGQMLDGLLARAIPDACQTTATCAHVEGSVRVLISPHAGYQYSGLTAAKGYKALQGMSYQRVVVLGPSHHAAFHGLALPQADAYETPLGQIPIDNRAVAILHNSKLVCADDYAHKKEHSIEMQLPMLQRVLAPGWSLVPILVGELDHNDYAKVADSVQSVVDSTTLVVVSSDFTHYGPSFGYRPFPLDATIASKLAQLDNGAIDCILAKDRIALLNYQQRTGITMCGIRPVGVLLQFLARETCGKVIDYTTSGQITGDYNHSVSYVSILFCDP